MAFCPAHHLLVMHRLFSQLCCWSSVWLWEAVVLSVSVTNIKRGIFFANLPPGVTGTAVLRCCCASCMAEAVLCLASPYWCSSSNTPVHPLFACSRSTRTWGSWTAWTSRSRMALPPPALTTRSTRRTASRPPRPTPSPAPLLTPSLPPQPSLPTQTTQDLTASMYHFNSPAQQSQQHGR